MAEIIAPLLSRMKRRHVYEPVGKCIYCGRSEAETALRTEHIIAQSLGGELQLPKASCDTCAAFTGAFEGRNASGMFQPIRKLSKFPRKNRGKKDRERQEQEMFVLKIDGKKVHLTTEEYPGLLHSFTFSYPTALMGAQPTFKTLVGKFCIGMLPEFDERLHRLHAKFGRNIEFPMRADTTDFGRMLAKFAYAYAVAQYGYDTFKPYVLGIVRGNDLQLLSHVVGGAISAGELAGDDLHEIEVLEPSVLDSGNLVVVKMRLFANRKGMPTHYVVVGERTSNAPSNILE